LQAQDRTLLITAQDLPQPLATDATIRQILNVLLDNALLHGHATISLTARHAGDTLAIEVFDEGAGIEPGREVFLRRDSPDGHDIGLPLARTLAEAVGGTLILRNHTPRCGRTTDSWC
jgi:signal transduction histidine kinase